MTEREPPSAGQVMVGIFLILFGAVLLLAGGGCTIVLIVLVVTSSTSYGDLASALPLLLLSLVALFLGFLSLKGAVSLLRGNEVAPPSGEEPPSA
jgi:hypothetical protein